MSVSALIAELSSDATITTETIAYYNFLQGKERAGIERAVLNNTFSKIPATRARISISCLPVKVAGKFRYTTTSRFTGCATVTGGGGRLGGSGLSWQEVMARDTIVRETRDSGFMGDIEQDPLLQRFRR